MLRTEDGYGTDVESECVFPDWYGSVRARPCYFGGGELGRILPRLRKGDDFGQWYVRQRRRYLIQEGKPVPDGRSDGSADLLALPKYSIRAHLRDPIYGPVQ